MTVINLRVKKRNIDDKAIDASKLEFLNQDEFKAQKADGTAASLFKLNASDKFELLKLPIVASNPTAADELARKAYVDLGDADVRSEFAAEDAAIRSEFAAADAAVLAEAKEYTDDKVAFEKGEREAEDALIRSEFAAADQVILQSAMEYTDLEVAEEAAARAAEDATFLKLDGSRPMTDDLNMGGREITGVYGITGATVGDGTEININSTLDMDDNRILYLPTPTSDHEAATKEYVDGEISGVLQDAKDYTDGEIQTHVTDKLGQPSGIATLDSFGKVPVSQLPNAIMEYQGMWSAATNTPMLSNAGNAAEDLGNVYKVSASGSVDFGSGAISFETGDYVILGANGWEKSDTTDAVSSVNGQAGVVVLDTDDVSEGEMNLYFTDSRARAAAVVDSYAGEQTDQAPSVRAVKELVSSSATQVDLEIASRSMQERLTISATDISNGYVDLAYKAHQSSLIPSIDRLLLIEEYDYTVSVVGGKTRLTFAGSIASGGFEALASGDKLTVRYLKDLR